MPTCGVAVTGRAYRCTCKPFVLSPSTSSCIMQDMTCLLWFKYTLFMQIIHKWGLGAAKCYVNPLPRIDCFLGDIYLFSAIELLHYYTLCKTMIVCDTRYGNAFYSSENYKLNLSTQSLLGSVSFYPKTNLV